MAQALLLAYRSKPGELAASATEQIHIKRVMHHVVPVTAFSAEIWVPKAAYQHDSRAGALETDYLLPSAVALGQIASADELQQYSPRSFPATPRSRYAVLARGYSHAENILYGARDRLRQLAATRERSENDAIVSSASEQADALPEPFGIEDGLQSAPGPGVEHSAPGAAPARAESVSSGATAMLLAAARAAGDAGVVLDPAALRAFYALFLKQMEEAEGQEEEAEQAGLQAVPAAAAHEEGVDSDSDDGEGHASAGPGVEEVSLQRAVARGLAAAGLMAEREQTGDMTPTSEGSSAAYSLHSLLPSALPGPHPPPPQAHHTQPQAQGPALVETSLLGRRMPLPAVPEASVFGAEHDDHEGAVLPDLQPAQPQPKASPQPSGSEGQTATPRGRDRGHRGSVDRGSSAMGGVDGLDDDEGEYLGYAVSVYAGSELVPAAVRHADDAPAPPLSPRTAFSAALAQAQAAVQEEAGKVAVAQLVERERALASQPRTIAQTHTFKHSFLHPRTIEARVMVQGQGGGRADSPAGQARTPPARMYAPGEGGQVMPVVTAETGDGSRAGGSQHGGQGQGAGTGRMVPVLRQDVPAVEATVLAAPSTLAVGHTPLPSLHIGSVPPIPVSSPTLSALSTATPLGVGRTPLAPSAAALFARMAAFDPDHVHPAFSICCGGHGVFLQHSSGAAVGRPEAVGLGGGGKAKKKAAEKASRGSAETDDQGAWSWAHVQSGLSMSGLYSACMRSGWVGARAGLAIPHYRPRDKSLCYFEFRIEQQALLAVSLAPGSPLHAPAIPPVCIGLSARSVPLEGVLGTFPLSCGWGSNGCLVTGGQWTPLQMAPSGLVQGPSLSSSSTGPCSYGVGDTVGVLVRWLGKGGPWWLPQEGGGVEEGSAPFEAVQLTFSVNGRVVGCSGSMVVPRDTELYPTVSVGGCSLDLHSLAGGHGTHRWGGGHWYDGSDHGAHGEQGGAVRADSSSRFRVVGHFSASDVLHSRRRSLLVTAQYAPPLFSRPHAAPVALDTEMAVAGLHAPGSAEPAAAVPHGMPAYTPGTGSGVYLAGTVGYAVFALDGSLLLGHEDQPAE